MAWDSLTLKATHSPSLNHRSSPEYLCKLSNTLYTTPTSAVHPVSQYHPILFCSSRCPTALRQRWRCLFDHLPYSLETAWHITTQQARITILWHYCNHHLQVCLFQNPGFVSSKSTQDPSVTKVARPEVDSTYSLWKMRNQIVDIQTSHQIWINMAPRHYLHHSWVLLYESKK